mmetsp:Transcript_2065/g.3270  ORF Transcript_2065/g.3270 Transcript_2065/m.3270 type:complete len:113 (+) Transcript_2065:72-410(+)
MPVSNQPILIRSIKRMATPNLNRLIECAASLRVLISRINNITCRKRASYQPSKCSSSTLLSLAHLPATMLWYAAAQHAALLSNILLKPAGLDNFLHTSVIFPPVVIVEPGRL